MRLKSIVFSGILLTVLTLTSCSSSKPCPCERQQHRRANNNQFKSNNYHSLALTDNFEKDKTDTGSFSIRAHMLSECIIRT